MAVQTIVIDNFIGGSAPSRYLGNPNGQFDSTDTTGAGFDPFTEDEVGILRRGLGEAVITDSAEAVTGDVTWMKAINRPFGTYVFGTEEQASGAGTNNRLIRIDASSHTYSNASPWPHVLPTDGGQCGLEFFNGFLYYASGRYLGRYDISLTFNNCYNTFLGTKAIGRNIDHPMVQGNAKLFIGNSNFSLNTASIAVDDGTVDLNRLDLSKTEQFVRALEFSRNTLFIAGSSNSGTGATTKTPNTMYVWDTVSTSYQDRFEFPDEDFHAIKEHNGKLFGFGQRGMYLFTGSGFELVQPYSGGPDPWGVATNPRGFITWKDELTTAWSYGSPHKDIPPIVTRPFQFSGTPAGGLFWVNKSTAYISGFTGGDKIRRLAGTSGYASATWKTPMLKFDDPVRLVQIEVHMLPYGAGNVNVLWAKDTGNSPTTIGAITASGETEWKYQPDGLVGDSWQIGLQHTSGATPKIKRIILKVESEKS